MSCVASISQLAEQYKDESNLSARQRIYRFRDPLATPWPRWVFEQLDLPAKARVLEVGCGNGVLWAQNLERVPSQWEVTLSDMSLGILQNARQKLGDHAARFRFEEFDAQVIPHRNEYFDGVIANHMLYHVPNRDRAIGEFSRVLKKGGKLVAATNGGGHLAQLFELIQRFIPLPEELRGGSFRLETGEAEL